MREKDYGSERIDRAEGTLDCFFAPRSVAVVGATANEAKGGYNILANMLESFRGPVYPVNPRRKEILGEKCFPSVRELRGKVDLAVVFVPASKVPEVLEDCAFAGVKGAVIESGGFAEVGDEGEELTRRCREIARRAGMRLWGPNCTGLVNTDPFIFTPFMRAPRVHERLRPGNLGIIAQSGMLAAGFMIQYVLSGFFDVSKACAIGNKIDVDEVEVLRYLSEDPHTGAVVAYLESIDRGRDFLEVAKGMRGRKPLVVLKGGKTEEAARAALSHTASMAGSDEVVEGALRQAGAFAVNDFHDMMNLGKAFSLHPEPFPLYSPSGDGIAVITVTGGGGVVSTDLLREAGLRVPDLEEATVRRLSAVFPDWMPPRNPVDIWPAIEQRGLGVFAEVLEAVLQDDRVDGVILLPFVSRQVEMFPFREIGAALQRKKKAVVSWLFGDRRFFEDMRRGLEEQGVPVYGDLHSCVLTLKAYFHHARNKELRS
jgi:acetyltransferase